MVSLPWVGELKTSGTGVRLFMLFLAKAAKLGVGSSSAVFEKDSQALRGQSCVPIGHVSDRRKGDCWSYAGLGEA